MGTAAERRGRVAPVSIQERLLRQCSLVDALCRERGCWGDGTPYHGSEVAWDAAHDPDQWGIDADDLAMAVQDESPAAIAALARLRAAWGLSVLR